MKKLILLASLAFSINAFAQVPSYIDTNGLVGYWPFNGNANDESGTGNNGTVNGATLTTDRFGNSNAAYSFNGISNSIDVQHSASLSIFGSQSPSTISVWFYGYTNQVEELINKGYHSINVPSYGNKYLAITNDTLSYQYTLYNFSTLNSVRGPNGYFNSQQWYHLVFVRDATSKVYVNGINLSTAANNAGWSTNYNLVLNNTDMSFGCRNNKDDNNVPFRNLFYNGKIDDIGIWNRALTSQEITDLYNGNICYQTITVTDTLIINANLTGYNPLSFASKIRIFPNPTKDHITIDYGNYSTLTGYTLKITNSLGQIVFTSPINQQQSYVSLNGWSGNGIYFVHLIDSQNNTIDIRKIVLQ